MSFFIDDAGAIDLEYVVAVFPITTPDLADEHPYAIGVLLHVGTTAEHVCLQYRTQAARDAALATVLGLIRADLDEQTDTPVDWDEEGKHLGEP